MTAGTAWTRGMIRAAWALTDAELRAHLAECTDAGRNLCAFAALYSATRLPFLRHEMKRRGL